MTTAESPQGVDYLILYRTADPSNREPWHLVCKPSTSAKGDGITDDTDAIKRTIAGVALPLSFRASSPKGARRLAAKSEPLASELGSRSIDMVAIPVRSWHEKLGAGFKPREPQLDI